MYPGTPFRGTFVSRNSVPGHVCIPELRSGARQTPERSSGIQKSPPSSPKARRTGPFYIRLSILTGSSFPTQIGMDTISEPGFAGCSALGDFSTGSALDFSLVGSLLLRSAERLLLLLFQDPPRRTRTESRPSHLVFTRRCKICQLLKS